MSLELSVFPFSWFNRSTNYEFRRLLYDARFEQCLVQCTFVIRVDNIKCKYPYIVYSPTLFFCQLLKWNDLFRFEVGIPTWMSCSTIWHFRRMAIDATVYANPISFFFVTRIELPLWMRSLGINSMRRIFFPPFQFNCFAQLRTLYPASKHHWWLHL